MATFEDKATHDALFGATEDRPDGGEWATPQAFFEELNAEFDFTLDAAATAENTKLPRFWTKEDNALNKSWDNEIVFCNPPYGRQIGQWLRKGITAQNSLVVFLVHARTDTKWFHECVYYLADEMRFIKGRLKFEHKDGTKQSAPFPSMVVIYDNRSSDAS